MVGPAEEMTLAHSVTRWSRATFQNRWVTLAPSAGSTASSWRAGLLLVVADEHVDVAVERGREQQRLAIVGREVEDLADLGQEAHVGHAVGLVDHDELDGVELDVAAVEQVHQAAGAGHGDVDAAAQRVELLAEAVAAVERLDEAAAGAGQQGQLVADLRGQLTGRHEHEALGAAGLGLADAGDHRDAEGDGLARPGGGLAAEVAAGEGVGQGHGLDGERRLDALLGEQGDDGRGDAEVGEGGGHGGLLERRDASASGS